MKNITNCIHQILKNRINVTAFQYCKKTQDTNQPFKMSWKSYIVNTLNTSYKH